MQRSTMPTSAGLLVAATALAVVASACGSKDPVPPTAPTATAYPENYIPPQGQPGAYPQGQPGAYPQGQPGAYPQPQPTGAETMAVPGPLALPCQNDGACGLHRCNVQYQKCAFPCAGPVDCAAGNQCMMGVCAPKMPGSP